MDCEKFDQIIIDALYDELDELTLAAAKRHTDGCQRCQTAWSGLRATRKIGILPLVEAPVGLEERILAAAREAQRNVAWPKRVGRAVSRAGAYAMRPQTAMAALFLVITGWALLFIRPKPDRSGAPSQVSVTERGVPEQALDEPAPKDKAPLADNRMPPGTPSLHRDDERAAASASPNAGPLALNEPPSEARKGGSPKTEGFAEAPPAAARARSANAASGAPADSLQDQQFAELDKKSARGGTGSVGGVQASPPAAPAPAGTAAAQPNDGFGAAMDLYKNGRFAEAEKAFNMVVASSGNPAAALYAAKSAEAAHGCRSAAAKYDYVASQYPSVKGEALWEGANCYKSLGDIENARSMYMQLRSVAGYRDRAEAEIANLQLRQQGTRVPAKAGKPAMPASKE
jgi:TolA-binding protein